jgi:hypothetical protein
VLSIAGKRLQRGPSCEQGQGRDCSGTYHCANHAQHDVVQGLGQVDEVHDDLLGGTQQLLTKSALPLGVNVRECVRVRIRVHACGYIT